MPAGEKTVVIAGSGNAALCAGIAALERGADALILEKAGTGLTSGAVFGRIAGRSAANG